MKNLIKKIKKHWKLIAIIIYIISPIDLIPDFLLPAGVGDDLLLTLWALVKYLKESENKKKK